jgi:hypothetical protein
VKERREGAASKKRAYMESEGKGNRKMQDVKQEEIDIRMVH